MFIVKMAYHDGNLRCHAEENVPIALILPSRWQDGGESLGMETTSCLWLLRFQLRISQFISDHFEFTTQKNKELGM